MWPTYSSLPHRLAPGPHVIEVSEKYTSGKKSKHFEYKQGETVYIDINRVEFEYHDFGEAVLLTSIVKCRKSSTNYRLFSGVTRTG